MIAILNSETISASQYSLAWLDIAEHEGEVYGLTSTGLVKLAGDIEATASPYVETGAMALATWSICNIPLVRLTMAADRDVVVTATGAVRGVSSPRVYRVAPAHGTQIRGHTKKLARGPRADEWTIRIAASPGGTLELAGAAVEVDRVKKAH